MFLRMTFGKYKGLPLEDIPTSYLQWLLRECDLDQPLARAARRELAVRAEDRGHLAEDNPPAWDGIVRHWYRELALKHHPDRGGSNEAMTAINDAHERLRELLQGQGCRA